LKKIKIAISMYLVIFKEFSANLAIRIRFEIKF